MNYFILQDVNKHKNRAIAYRKETEYSLSSFLALNVNCVSYS